MQYATTTPADLDWAITTAREARNAELPPTVKDADGSDKPNPAIIPNNVAYLDFVLGSAVQSWAAQHAQVAPPPPPPVVLNGVPQVISYRQAKTFMQLYPFGGSNLWKVANDAADAIQDPVRRVKTQNLLRDSTVYERQRQELVDFAAEIGINGAGLDFMFTEANRL